jgi:hypothetical protein
VPCCLVQDFGRIAKLFRISFPDWRLKAPDATDLTGEEQACGTVGIGFDDDSHASFVRYDDRGDEFVVHLRRHGLDALQIATIQTPDIKIQITPTISIGMVGKASRLIRGKK